MGYEVSTPVFEGPFDLLLQLITSQEVDVCDVPIASIVDRFVAEMGRVAGSLDLETATSFALIAATLIQLKCRKLLPVPEEVELDEEIEMWEARDLLLSKLLEFSAFREAATELRARMEAAALSFPRRAGLEERYLALTPDPLEGTKPARLRDALVRLLQPKSQPELKLDHVTVHVVSVTETVRRLASRLASCGSATFRELTDGMVERIEVVVAFLAVLELHKQDLVDLEQAERFGEIVVTWTAGEERALDVHEIEVSAELEGAVGKVLASVSEEYNG
jgi:segregation and condensation protein A